MKKQTWFECVQVNERWPDGRIKNWYPGDKHATESGAAEEAKHNAKHFDADYQVIEVTLTERRQEFSKRKKAIV